MENCGEYLRLQVDRQGVESFVICVALGVLSGIKSGKMKPEAAIWTLGRPVFCAKEHLAGLVSGQVLQVLHRADEIDAVFALAGTEQGIAMVSSLIDELERRLGELDLCWRAAWCPIAPNSGAPQDKEKLSSSSDHEPNKK